MTRRLLLRWKRRRIMREWAGGRLDYYAARLRLERLARGY
jgi:hypothetical protein